MTRAKATLQEGAALLSECQKLIKIANRLANGWSIIANMLTKDRDNEKRIEKAKKAAERKVGLKWRKKQQPLQKGGPSV